MPTKADFLKDPAVQEEYRKMTEDLVKGVPPLKKNDDAYADSPTCEYEIDEVLNDLILAEYVDEDGGNITRGGIYLPETMSSTHAWRTAKVLKVGPDVPDSIVPGVFIRFPDNKGIPTSDGNKKMIFLNAERIFCTMKKKAKK